MTEKTLGGILVGGTALFLALLAGLTLDSLSEVTAAGTPPLTDAVVAGKRVWQRKNCNDCHTILGIGAYLAPELTKVANRRDTVWLGQWLKDPRAVRPGTTMPDQRLTDSDVGNLVAFLQWVSRINTQNWPPQPMMALGGGGPSGTLLFQQKGCSACHMINGQGASGPGPDLSRIGAQPYDGLPNTAEFLTRWLENPQAEKPGTLMPRLPLAEAERDALVQYLIGLK